MKSSYRGILLLASVAFLVPPGGRPAQAQGLDRRVQQAGEVLKEMLNTTAKGIPRSMLTEAQGVVIIPEVIKVGFILGVQRGEGVALARDDRGKWQLPRFVTITAGSVGWQLGAQSSDFILVFQTRRGVDGLMKGKFTIGADADAAVGPVGRQIGAATDAKMSAEILTYSRSRGLFAGVSLAGSKLDINPGADLAFYGAQGTPQARVPESAVQLVQLISSVSGGGQERIQPLAPQAAGGELAGRRAALLGSARALDPLLNDEWRRFLALPRALSTANANPSAAEVEALLNRFTSVATDARYQSLSGRPEFAAMQDSLARYLEALTPTQTINLPPPPVNSR
jgi:lipid-binding SYLF domain-containing protein